MPDKNTFYATLKCEGCGHRNNDIPNIRSRQCPKCGKNMRQETIPLSGTLEDLEKAISAQNRSTHETQ